MYSANTVSGPIFRHNRLLLLNRISSILFSYVPIFDIISFLNVIGKYSNTISNPDTFSSFFINIFLHNKKEHILYIYALSLYFRTNY